MEFIKITEEQFDELKELQIAYKEEIGEEKPSIEQLNNLKEAIKQEKIFFYGCYSDNKLVASCSICVTFSTFDYNAGGVFEDFYIKPEYRHKGIARKLVAYAYEMSQVCSLTVGCADCDVPMYKAIGFNIPLGNLFAYGE